MKIKLSFLTLILFLLSAVQLVAQSATNGAIGGTVYDTMGAAIVGAQITAVNDETGHQQQATSGESGNFRILEVAPGNYTVTIASSNTKTHKEHVIVSVGVLTNITPTLEVGSVETVVEVTDVAPAMQTESAEISTSIDQTSIDNLPINGRRWSNFALLTPGVVSNSDGFGLLSFRGVSYLLNNSTVDGMDDNQAYFSEQRGRTRAAYAISQAAVQEFQINTSNFSAEYGRSAGGVINTVTKSGGRHLHGELFFYDRDNSFGAKNPYTLVQTLNSATGNYDTSVIKPKDWRKQWGFGVGGPLYKDKLFWFYSYDQQKRNFPGLARASDPADTFAAPGTTYGNAAVSGIASALAVNTQSATAYYNQGLQIINSFLGVVPRQGDQMINFPRLDWQATERDHVAVQYNRQRWDSPAGVQTQASNFYGRGSFGNDYVKEDFGIIRWTHTLSNSMLNELRFQAGRDFEFETSQKPLPNELPLANNAFNHPPDVQIGSYFPDQTGFDIGKPILLERKAMPEELRIQGEDIWTWSHGKHVTKAGIDVNRVNDFISNLYGENGSYSYDYSWDFIADYLHSALGVGPSNYVSNYYSYSQGWGTPAGEIGTSDYNGFVTDDWRITPRLTLTLGLRYEYEYIPSNPFQNTSLKIGAVTPLAPGISTSDVLTTFKPDDRNNIAPRLGFAYDLYGNGKTYLRGGYGMYYGRIINANILQSYMNNGNPANGQVYISSVKTSTSGSPSFPNVPTSASALQAMLAAQPARAAFVDKNLKNPQVHMIDLALEQKLGPETSFSIAYMGSLGREFTSALNVNSNPATTSLINYTVKVPAATASTGYVTYPHGGVSSPLADGTVVPVNVYTPTSFTSSGFYQLLELKSNANSAYHALAFQFRHRMSHGFQLMANYTWSHALDYNPYIGTGYGSYTMYDPANFRAEYGNSSLDVRNRAVLSGVWAPRVHGTHAFKLLADGWRISPILQVQNGLHYSPMVSKGPTGGAYSTINGAGGSNRIAMLGRNGFTAPALIQTDLRIAKNFYLDKFGQHWRFEILGEVFNLPNHQNITKVNNTAFTTSGSTSTGVGTLTFSPTFGTYLNSNSNLLFSERQMQLGARLHF